MSRRYHNFAVVEPLSGESSCGSGRVYGYRFTNYRHLLASQSALSLSITPGQKIQTTKMLIKSVTRVTCFNWYTN